MNYEDLCRRELRMALEEQDKLLPILSDHTAYKTYPIVLQDLIYKEAKQLNKKIEHLNQKINDYLSLPHEDRVVWDMALFHEIKKGNLKST